MAEFDEEIRALWQARALAAASGKRGAVMLSVLAHSFDEGNAMLNLLRIVFPGFISIRPPFLCTAGRVRKDGAIVADVVNRDGSMHKQAVIYRNETELRDDFRKLADELKFSDRERKELFAAVKRWVVADYRLDPTMDPQDPDAKRLGLH